MNFGLWDRSVSFWIQRSTEQELQTRNAAYTMGKRRGTLEMTLKSGVRGYIGVPRDRVFLAFPIDSCLGFLSVSCRDSVAKKDDGFYIFRYNI